MISLTLVIIQKIILYSIQNKKVVGKFKDEVGGRLITEFVGLRSKMYSLQIEDPISKKITESKKCKGVKKCVVKKSMKHINNPDAKTWRQKEEMTMLRSYNQVINTIKLTKISLSAYDNKRFMLDAANSRAYGHYEN